MKNKNAICVPTCGGDLIFNCLKSLELSSDFSFDLIVAFNGSKIEFDKFNSLKSEKFDIRVFFIEEPGVVYVRNFFIDHCFYKENYNYLIMLDDDQQVDQNWYESLIFDAETSQCDIIGSYVKPIFLSSELQSWMSKLNVYYLNKRPTGFVQVIHGTGGSLLSRNFIINNNIKFDTVFAKTGGEDADFFIRSMKLGAKFFRSSNAFCFETIDSKRANLLWAKQRYYRIGFCDAKINTKFNIKSKILFYFFAIISLLGYYIFSCLSFSSDSRKKSLCLVYRQLGKISFMLGLNKEFYFRKKG